MPEAIAFSAAASASPLKKTVALATESAFNPCSTFETARVLWVGAEKPKYSDSSQTYAACSTSTSSATACSTR
jgi:hypothetical protein